MRSSVISWPDLSTLHAIVLLTINIFVYHSNVTEYFVLQMLSWFGNAERRLGFVCVLGLAGRQAVLQGTARPPFPIMVSTHRGQCNLDKLS
jgi:hypothetical protein